jgi:hypothetical protein
MDSIMNNFLIFSIAPLAIYLFYWGIRRTIGTEKQKEFIKMNPLKGKTFEFIKEKVGPPNMILANTRTWSAGHYHITLIFDQDDICLGVQSEMFLGV